MAEKKLLKMGPFLLLGTQTISGPLTIATENCLSIFKAASFVFHWKDERQSAFLFLHA